MCCHSDANVMSCSSYTALGVCAAERGLFAAEKFLPRRLLAKAKHEAPARADQTFGKDLVGLRKLLGLMEVLTYSATVTLIRLAKRPVG